MTAPDQDVESLPAGLAISAPFAGWGLVIGALFHHIDARRPTDPDVAALDVFCQRITEGLLDAGVSEERLAAMIGRTAACERCGCMAHRACEGGCGWAPAFSAVQRFVCTRCVADVPPPGESRWTPARRILLAGDPGFRPPT